MSEFSHTAIGVFRDPETGLFCVAEISYNPSTGEVGKLTKVVAGPDRAFGVEKFKMKAVEHALV